MNKKQGILLAIALMLLFAGIVLATSSSSSDVEIYAFDQNHDGYSVEPKTFINTKENGA